MFLTELGPIIKYFFWYLNIPDGIILTYINVKIGDKLGCNVNTSLFASAGGKICITVPAAADRVGISGGRGCMLDPCGGHDAY